MTTTRPIDCSPLTWLFWTRWRGLLCKRQRTRRDCRFSTFVPPGIGTTQKLGVQSLSTRRPARLGWGADEETTMTEDLSRRKFLEKIGVGTAAGTGLWLFKDVAQASPAPLPSRNL